MNISGIAIAQDTLDNYKPNSFGRAYTQADGGNTFVLMVVSIRQIRRELSIWRRLASLGECETWDTKGARIEVSRSHPWHAIEVT